MDPFSILVWIIVDCIVIIFTSYISLWCNGSANTELINSWYAVLFPTAAAHIVVFLGAGLYRLDQQQSYLRLLIRVVKGCFGGLLLSLALSYFFRDTEAPAFPGFVWALFFILNLITFGIFRIVVKRSNDDHNWINHKIEEVIWRILEAIVINLGFLLAFWVKFQTLGFTNPEFPHYNDFSYYSDFLFIPITISFLIGIIVSRLYRLADDDWFGRIIWRSLKSGIIGTILALGCGFLLVGKGYSLSGSLYILGGTFATILLATWHLCRRRYNWLLEVDIYAIDPESDMDC